MKNYISILMLACLTGIALSFKTPDYPAKQNNFPVAKIKWLTLKEAVEKNKEMKKKIFIHIYGEDCEWSKYMDETTFMDQQIADYINDNYYPVKFDIASSESVRLNNQVYKSVKEGEVIYHELIGAITNGELSTPAIAFLDEDLKLIQSMQGYKNANSFEKIMTYIGGNHFKKVPWTNYQSTFKSAEE